MENKLSSFFNSINNREIKIIPSVLFLVLINIIFFLIYYGKIFIIVDTSREVYIPFAMNNGEILYKDILNVYSPLGYQINAFLTSMFGDNLNTFYIAGLINSTLILAGLLLILRILFDKKNTLIVFSILFLIISACFYPISYTGYIFPYSYSMVYALCAFIWSLSAVIYYLKKDRKKYLYLSFLIYGICLSCRYEFIPFLLILIGVLIYKKERFKTLFSCLLLFICVPALCFTYLILQGLNFNDINLSIFYIIKLSKAKSTIFLYNYLGFIPSFANLKLLTISFLNFIIYIFAITIYLKFISFIYKKTRTDKYNIFLFAIESIIPIIVLYFLYKEFIISNAFIFNWIGVFSICLFILFCISICKKKDLTQLDKIFFITFLSAIICSLKSVFNISFNSYGTYFFPILYICSAVYIYKYLLKNNFSKSICIFIIFTISLLYTSSNIQRMNLVYDRTNIIKTEKGTFQTDKQQSKIISKLLSYLSENTKESDNILIMPEGAFINYLANRKSNSQYYYLIPPNVEIFSEEKIINDISNNLPEYIILQPMYFENFGETFFCESYGEKICSTILKYYETPYVIQEENNNFWIAIYKKVKNTKNNQK